MGREGKWEKGGGDSYFSFSNVDSYVIGSRICAFDWHQNQ